MLSIYKASAGSGKTYTLTLRYIKMLLGHKDEKGRYHLRSRQRGAHRQILAVTFTKKATEEMKRRIIHELAVLAHMEPGWTAPSPYLHTLTADFGCTPQALSQAAGQALRELLFDFGFFQVSTIDSFFQLILRTFAREAELTGNFEVDLDSESALENGLKNLYDSLRTDPGSPGSQRLVGWITQFLLSEMRGGRAIAIFNRTSGAFGQLLQFLKRTEAEEFKRMQDEMMDYLSDPALISEFSSQLTSARTSHEQATSQACSDALEYIENAGYGKGITALVTKRLKDGMENGYNTGKTEGTTIAKVLYEPLDAFKGPLKKKQEKSPDYTLRELIATAFTLLDEGWVLRKLWSTLQRQIYSMGLLYGVFGKLRELCTENNTLLLSDTNSILRTIIGDDDSPFVFERIGVWLNHFLIDEFQDTSAMQWEILRPLVAQGQAIDADSLIIGDEKQCIYRFRSSDPTLLAERVPADFSGQLSIEGNTPGGNTNWRSAAEVVTFNNALFAHLASSMGLESVYANVKQGISPKHTAHQGLVSITGIDIDTVGEFEDAALDILTENIRRQLRAGYLPKDICVLVRKVVQGEKVIAHLTDLSHRDKDFKGIRVISDDSMLLHNAPVVRHIVSVLRNITTLTQQDSGENIPHKKRRRLELQRMINRYEYMRSLGSDATSSLVDAVAHRHDEASDCRHEYAEMENFNVLSLVERIIGNMSEDLRDGQNMYLSAFQDAVVDFCASGAGDAVAFLDWWDRNKGKLSVSAPDNDRAIRVMTIHKSKGLEFECVHIPMLFYNMVEFKGDEWFPRADIPGVDPSVVPPLLSLYPTAWLERTAFGTQYVRRCREQLLDELNILYVAFTRAGSELCVTFRSKESDADTYPVGGRLLAAMRALSDMMGEGKNSTRPHTAKDGEDPSEYEMTVWEYGTPTVPQERGDKKTTALDATGTFPMPPYRTLPRHDIWQNTALDSAPDYTTPRGRGVVLHDVLSRVTSASTLQRAVTACIRARLLPPEEAPGAQAFLATQISRPEVAPWFSGYTRLLTERPLILPDGKILRPDRVVWHPDGTVDVIDYKFGSPKESYRRQVREYAVALRSMGYGRVRAFLWYVAEGEILEIKD